MRHGSLGLGTLWDRHYIHVREAVNPTMAMVFGVNHYQGWLGEVVVVPVYRSRKQDLTILPSKVTRSRGQVDTEDIGLPNVQQMFHLCIARSYKIYVNFMFKHIHSSNINIII